MPNTDGYKVDTARLGKFYDNLQKSGKFSQEQIGDKDAFVYGLSNPQKLSKFYDRLYGMAEKGALSVDEIGSKDAFMNNFLRPDGGADKKNGAEEKGGKSDTVTVPGWSTPAFESQIQGNPLEGARVDKLGAAAGPAVPDDYVLPQRGESNTVRGFGKGMIKIGAPMTYHAMRNMAAEAYLDATGKPFRDYIQYIDSKFPTGEERLNYAKLLNAQLVELQKEKSALERIEKPKTPWYLAGSGVATVPPNAIEDTYVDQAKADSLAKQISEIENELGLLDKVSELSPEELENIRAGLKANGKAPGSTASKVLGALAPAPSTIMSPVIGESLYQYSQDVQKDANEKISSLPEAVGFGAKSGAMVLQVAPSLIAAGLSLVPGMQGAAAVMAKVAVAGIVASAGGMSAYEVDRYEIEHGITVTPSQRITTIVSSMAVEILTEKIGIEAYLPKGLAGKIISKSMLKRITPEVADRILTDFVTKNPEFRHLVIDGAEKFARGVIPEGFEEALADLGGEIAEAIYKDPEDLRSIKELLMGMAESAFYGSFMMVPTATLNMVASPEAKLRVDQARANNNGKATLVKSKDGSVVLEYVGKKDNGDVIGYTYNGVQMTIAADDVGQWMRIDGQRIAEFEAMLNDKEKSIEFEKAMMRQDFDAKLGAHMEMVTKGGETPIVQGVGLRDGRTVFIKEGDPYQNEGPSYLIGVDPETGENVQFSRQDIKNVEESTADDYRKELMAGFEARLNNMFLDEQQTIDQAKNYSPKNGDMRTAPDGTEHAVQFVDEDSGVVRTEFIDKNGRKAHKKWSIDDWVKNTTPVVPLDEKIIAGQVEQEAQAQAEAEQAEEQAQSEMVTLTIPGAKGKETQIQARKVSDTEYEVGEGGMKPGDANKIAKSLNDEYPNMEFTVVDNTDKNDPFAKANYSVVGTIKAPEVNPDAQQVEGETPAENVENVPEPDLFNQGEQPQDENVPVANVNTAKAERIKALSANAENAAEDVFAEKQDELIDVLKANGASEGTIAAVQAEMEAGNLIEGFYDPDSGKVYWVTENLSEDEGKLQEKWVHEQGIHNGIRQLTGNKEGLNNLMDKVFNDIGADKISEVVPEEYRDADGRVLAEEYLAFLGEKMYSGQELTAQERSIWEKIIAEIRAMLGMDAKFTDEDIARIIKASVDKVVGSKPGTPSGEVQGETKTKTVSNNKPVTPNNENIKRKISDKYSTLVDKRVTINGEEGVMRRSDGGVFTVETKDKIYEITDLKDDILPVRENIVGDVSENTATVNGKVYDINIDDKGNIVSLSNDKDIINNENTLIDVEIKRNRLDGRTDDDVNTEIEEQGVSFNERNAIDNLLNQNMTEGIAGILENGITNETTENDLLGAELWIEDAIKQIEKNYPDSEYAKAIKESLIDVQKIINNEADTRKQEKPTDIKSQKDGIKKDEAAEKPKVDETPKVENNDEGIEVVDNEDIAKPDKEPEVLAGDLLKSDKQKEVEAEGKKVEKEPTEGQKEAGNYQMGHVKIHGMDVTIENPAGSVRKGVDEDGNEWESKMNNTYGYIRGSKGKDGDHIDVFLNTDPETGKIFVIDQVNPKTGEFDEHKVMVGFNSEQEAREAYLSNYEDGWNGLGNITEVSIDDFKKWAVDGKKKRKPFADYKKNKPKKNQNIAKKESKQDQDIPPKPIHEGDEQQEWIAKYSEDPNEIYEAFKRDKEEFAPINRLQEWEQFVLGHHITSDSFIRFGDKSYITQGMAKRFFRKRSNGGTPIDEIVESLRNNDSDSGVKAAEINESDVVNLIVRAAKDPSITRRTTHLTNSLRARYKEITGQSINHHEELIKLAKKAEKVSKAQQEILSRGIRNLADLEALKATPEGKLLYDDEDYEAVERYIRENSDEHGNIQNGGELVRPKGEGQSLQEDEGATERIRREVRAEHEEELSYYDKKLKEAKDNKAKKEAEFNNRNSLFGDKENLTPGEMLFPSDAEFTPESLKAMLSEYQGEIDRIQAHIDFLNENLEKKIADRIEAEKNQQEMDFESPVNDEDDGLPFSKRKGEFAGDLLTKGNKSNTFVENKVNAEETPYGKEGFTGEPPMFSKGVSHKRNKAIDNSPEQLSLWEEANYSPTSNDNVLERNFERILEKKKGMTFMGSPLSAPAKITSANDVAFLFKNLEEAATEHSFAVHHKKDGSYKVQYLGTGATDAVIVDMKQVAAAAKDFGAEAVTIVHNHPSGSLTASDADKNIAKRIRKVLKDIGVNFRESIIINTDSGEYAIIVENQEDTNVEKKQPITGDVSDVEVFSFERSKLYKPSNEKTKIQNSEDVSSYLSKMKRGTTPKIHLVVVDNQLRVNDYELIDETATIGEITEKALYNVGKYGHRIIIASNKTLSSAFIDTIDESLANMGSRLLDAVTINQAEEIKEKYNSHKNGVRFSKKHPQTDTKEFKKWFRGSKVVDADKNPQVVYHGTGTTINQFDPKFTGLGTDQLGSGFYFTTNEQAARGYMNVKGKDQNTGLEAEKPGGEDNPNVVDAFLSIKKPIIVEGNTLYDGKYNITKRQAELIIRRVPGIKENEGSVLGDYFEEYWEVGYQPWMITELAKDYSGKKLIDLENDFFDGNPTAFRKAVYWVTGYDGVKKTFDNTEETHYVAWFPNQIKSASKNNGEFSEDNPDIRFSKKQEPTFAGDLLKPQKIGNTPYYSNVEEALKKIQPKGTVAQMKKNLLNNGAKPVELDWMGFDDHFGDANKKVTREDIQEWIDQNKVEVEEVVKQMFPVTRDDVENVVQNSDGEWEVTFKEEAFGTITQPDAATAAEAINLSIAELEQSGILDENTKFSQYTLPGGKNYREVLLRLDNEEKVQRLKNEIRALVKANPEYQKNRERINEITDGIVKGKYKHDGKEAKERGSLELINDEIGERLWGDKWREMDKLQKKFYKKEHYSEGNILTHIRQKDRTATNGDRVLFVEEFQSDWAQEGKRKGFKSDTSKMSDEEIINTYAKRNNIDVTIDRENNNVIEIDSDGDIFQETIEEAVSSMREALDSQSMTPDMPYKKTDQWLQLAMKHTLHEAAQNGYDRIAWTTGEQQAERYDLSKQVDYIIKHNENSINKANGQIDVTVSLVDGMFGLEVDKKTGMIVGQNGSTMISQFEGRSLDEVLGKEISDKILKLDESEHTLKEDDLKIGGEGMKSFYDNIVPKNANKLGKPFGAKVEHTTIEIEGKETQFQSLPVTDKMRESTADGVPLFSKRKKGKLSQKGQNASDDKLVKSKIDRLRYDFQDNFLPWLKLKQMDGVNISDYTDVHAHASKVSARDEYEIKQFEKKFREPFVNHLANIASETGLTFEQISDYLMHKHAPERNATIEERTDGANTHGAGIKNEDGTFKTNEEIEDAINDYEAVMGQYNVDRLWELVNAINDFRLETLLNSGRISKQAYDEIKDNAWEYYVPLQGWEEDNSYDIYDYEEETGGTDVSLHKAKGRGSKAEDPISVMINAATSAITSANANKLKQRAYYFIIDNPQIEGMEIIGEYEKLDDDGKWYPIRQQPTDEELELGEQEEVGGVRIREDYSGDFMSEYRVKNSKITDKFRVKVWINGQQMEMDFSKDNRLAEGLKRENIAKLGYVGKHILRPATKFLSEVNTSYNPNFILNNVFRDVGFVLNTALAEDPKLAAQYIANLPKANKAIIKRFWTKNYKPETELEKALEDFERLGGITGISHMRTIAEEKALIDKQLRAAKRKSERSALANGIITVGGSPARTVKNITHLTKGLAEWSENQTRFAVYLAFLKAKEREARKAGHSKKEAALIAGRYKEQAASAAKEATVNFNRTGKYSGKVGAAFMFFNARVQGIERFFRLFKKAPVAATTELALRAGMGFAMRMLLDNWMFGDDKDDEGVKKSAKISKYMKNNYLLIPWKDTENYISLPLSHGHGMAYAMGGIIYDAIMEDSPDKMDETIKAGIDAIISNSVPFDLGQITNKDGELSIRPFVPSLAIPFYDIATNSTFTGAPVYPEPFTKEQEDEMAKSQMYYDNVNPTIKSITDWLYVQGGGEIRGKDSKNYQIGTGKKIKRVTDISPEEVEHVIETALGGTGKFYNDLVKSAVLPIFEGLRYVHQGQSFQEGAKERLKDVEANDIPVVQRVFRNTNIDPVKKVFYDELDKARDYIEDSDMLVRSSDPKDRERGAKMKENPKMEEAQRIKYAGEMLSKSRGAKKKGYETNEIDEWVRKQQLEIYNKKNNRK